jgi:hypothetical protein
MRTTCDQIKTSEVYTYKIFGGERLTKKTLKFCMFPYNIGKHVGTYVRATREILKDLEMKMFRETQKFPKLFWRRYLAT